MHGPSTHSKVGGANRPLQHSGRQRPTWQRHMHMRALTPHHSVQPLRKLVQRCWPQRPLLPRPPKPPGSPGCISTNAPHPLSRGWSRRLPPQPPFQHCAHLMAPLSPPTVQLLMSLRSTTLESVREQRQMPRPKLQYWRLCSPTFNKGSLWLLPSTRVCYHYSP